MKNKQVDHVIIAHPMDSFHPAQGGGIRYLMNILHGLREKDCDVTIIGTQANSPPASAQWRQIALSPESENAILGWVRYLLLLFLRLFFIKLPSDAVVVTHRMDCMLAFVLFKRQHAKVMISATPAHYLRGKFPLFYKWFGGIYRFAERVCVNGVDLIVPVDPVTADYYRTHYPNAHVTACVPSALDESFFVPLSRQDARAQLGISQDKQMALFVGRLSKVKNIPLLIRAFVKVEKLLPNAWLHLVGNGEEAAELKILAASCCQRVVFEGAIAPDKVVPYYAAANVSVLCSIEEGSPTVVKEALACGTSVVSTNVGDVALTLADHHEFGRIVAGHPDALAEMLIHYLKKEHDHDKRAPRRKAMQKYRVAEISAQLHTIFDHALEIRLNKRNTEKKIHSLHEKEVRTR